MQTGYRREYTDDTSKEDERMAKYKEHRLSDDEEDYENSEVIQEGSASNNIGEAIIYNLQMQLAIMDKVAWINHQMENNERAMEQLQAVAMEEEEAEKQRARDLNLPSQV